MFPVHIFTPPRISFVEWYIFQTEANQTVSPKAKLSKTTEEPKSESLMPVTISLKINGQYSFSKLSHLKAQRRGPL